MNRLLMRSWMAYATGLMSLLNSLISPLLGGEISKSHMLTHLDFIQDTFEGAYAPADWKKSHSKWDLKKEIGKAKSQVKHSKQISLKAYQEVLKTFFNSLQDYHAGILFYSTESASLPFRVRCAEGRYFLTWVDRKALPSKKFPYGVGDELIEFDGRPTREVVNQLIKLELPVSNKEAGDAFADYLLTKRKGSFGHQIPQGKILLTFKNNSKGSTTYEMQWMYTPEKIKSPLKTLSKPPKEPLLDTSLIDLSLSEMLDIDDSFSSLKKGFLPDLGSLVWRSKDECRYHAYVYMTEEGKTGGYIRIADYTGDSADVDEFQEIIQRFEEDTDFLVIDQLDNPGGNVFYLYALLTYVTNTRLDLPKHRFILSQREVSSAMTILSIFEELLENEEADNFIGAIFEELTEDNKLFGFPINAQLTKHLLSYLRFTVDQWNLGKCFTDPVAPYGIEYLMPNPETHYTKPVIVLTNSCDASAADFFPAILQDNHRATILGTRTAGAGGFIRNQAYFNLFGIARIFWTGSFAERINGKPIENLGVTPDIPYHLTVDDLQNNYPGYIRKINKEALKLTR